MDRLVGALSHRSGRVREEACKLLVSLAPVPHFASPFVSSAVDHLVKALDDPLPAVREAAMGALKAGKQLPGAVKAMRCACDDAHTRPQQQQHLFESANGALAGGGVAGGAEGPHAAAPAHAPHPTPHAQPLPSRPGSAPGVSRVQKPTLAAGGTHRTAPAATDALAQAADAPRPLAVSPADDGLVKATPCGVGSERDLEREAEGIAALLGATQEWDVRMGAMAKLEGLVLGGAAATFEACFTGPVLRVLRDPLVAQLQDRRSSVVKQATHLVVVLATALGAAFESTAEALLPALFGVVIISIKVMSDAGCACGRGLLAACHGGRLATKVAEAAKGDRNAKLRSACFDWLANCLAGWEEAPLEKALPAIDDALRAGVGDADAEARAAAKRAAVAYAQRAPDAFTRLCLKAAPEAAKRLRAAAEGAGAGEAGGGRGTPKPSAQTPRPLLAAVKAAAAKRHASAAGAASVPLVSVVAPPPPPQLQQPAQQHAAQHMPHTPAARRAASATVLPVAAAAAANKADAAAFAGGGGGAPPLAPAPAPAAPAPPLTKLSLSLSLPRDAAPTPRGGGGGEEASSPFVAAPAASPPPPPTPPSPSPTPPARPATAPAAHGAPLSRSHTLPAPLGFAQAPLGFPALSVGAALVALTRTAPGAAAAGLRADALGSLGAALRGGGSAEADAEAACDRVAVAISDGVDDPQPRVAAAALDALLCLAVHAPRCAAWSLERLLPGAFARLVDVKEPLREAASAALAALSEALPCEALLPPLLRALDAARTARGRTGVLEFALHALCAVGQSQGNDGEAEQPGGVVPPFSVLRSWAQRVAPLATDKHPGLRNAAVANLVAVWERCDPAALVAVVGSLPAGDGTALRKALAPFIPSLEEHLAGRGAIARTASGGAATPGGAGGRAPFVTGTAAHAPHPQPLPHAPLPPPHAHAPPPHAPPTPRTPRAAAVSPGANAPPVSPDATGRPASRGTAVVSHAASSSPPQLGTLPSLLGELCSPGAAVSLRVAHLSEVRSAAASSPPGSLAPLAASLAIALLAVCSPEQPPHLRVAGLEALREVAAFQHGALEAHAALLAASAMAALAAASPTGLGHPAEAALGALFARIDPQKGVDALPSLLAAAEAAAGTATPHGAHAAAVAVQCVSAVVTRASPAALHTSLPSLMPPLIAFFASPFPDVRKATVYALVDLHLALGAAALGHFLQPLSGAQRKLLDVYLQRTGAAAHTADAPA